MLFLFDPRTERVIGEPDSGNKAILDLCQRGGMHCVAVSRFRPFVASRILADFTFSSSEDIRFSVQEVFNYVESVR